MACAMTAMPAQANTPGLVLHWSFDEATVTDNAVGDVSGMGLELNPMSWAPGVVASMIPAVNAWWFGAVDT
ncbi:MAG TPA: hypothetical protein ENI94_10735 [Gammaproteobacteria bacterium]|nr:hypothetical protein [Gammaproteobacteria bacterium]